MRAPPVPESLSVTRASKTLEGPLRLGFGCASLGSRIEARAGGKALAAAYEAGVGWYDVAPAYGLGEAEALLGQFLQGRRHDVSVTTKVGIAPPSSLRLMKQIYSLGRPALSLAAGLRGAFRKWKPTRNRHVPLDPALVESSIANSLKRLRTEYVDVYALHDPTPEDVRRDEILRALEKVVARGQARAIAVAGKTDACRAALQSPEVYGLLQMSVADFLEDRALFANCGKTIVLHSVFGVGEALDRARKGDEPGAADRLLTRALTLNPNGPVLTSMFSPKHLRANVEVARAFHRSVQMGWRASA